MIRINEYLWVKSLDTINIQLQSSENYVELYSVIVNDDHVLNYKGKPFNECVKSVNTLLSLEEDI